MRVIIVNEKDEIIGEKNIGDIKPDDIYRVTGLWIRDKKGDILLARRSYTKKHDPGKWGPAAAGTVEVGETYDSNVVKEAEEELGIKNLTLIKGPKIRRSGKYNYFTQWYIAVLDQPDNKLTPDPKEVAEIKWLTVDELRKEILKSPEEYLISMDKIDEIFLHGN